MSIQSNTNIISISKKSFFQLILFTLIILLIIYIRSLLLTLAISFVIASFAKYFAQSLQNRYKIAYKYGLAFIFIILLITVILGVLQLLPLLIREGYGLFETISIFIKDFEIKLNESLPEVKKKPASRLLKELVKNKEVKKNLQRVT
jgi:predicted PurR-regulated permease PerM